MNWLTRHAEGGRHQRRIELIDRKNRSGRGLLAGGGF
jgi:hypothetical protein